jgi:hypothetical protein
MDACQTPAPSEAEQPDRKHYYPQPQASKHFAITATLNTQKTAFFHDSLLTFRPIDFLSTKIDAPQTPAPLTPKKPNGNTIYPNHKPHNTFP